MLVLFLLQKVLNAKKVENRCFNYNILFIFVTYEG